MFVERAAALGEGFALTDANACGCCSNLPADRRHSAPDGEALLREARDLLQPFGNTKALAQ